MQIINKQSATKASGYAYIHSYKIKTKFVSEPMASSAAQGEAECYIDHETLTEFCILHTIEVAVF